MRRCHVLWIKSLVLAALFFPQQSHSARVHELSHVRGPLKFIQFSPILNDTTVAPISREECAASWNTYTHAFHNGSMAELDHACLQHQTCILDNLSESAKAFMSSAGLVLGLGPILFSTCGPTISEIALLSLNRPFLAALLSLGSVGAYPSRIMSYTDDSAWTILQEPTTLRATLLQTLLKNTSFSKLLSIGEYLFAAAAIANVSHMSWSLGRSAVLILIVRALLCRFFGQAYPSSSSCQQWQRCIGYWFRFGEGIAPFGTPSPPSSNHL
ncbi:hypothetical protein B0I35DRAFT_437453 [Stachybotrys elegans]|uniref:Solute carrier family 40 protein n=1 Tax=Stachybotrys elegans TaxID=80388 RepID=A0A8K0SMW9_9HYPO|nr:hypothetical protein B0I35DRAFT_437453 [Stachybotrys elegans]